MLRARFLAVASLALTVPALGQSWSLEGSLPNENGSFGHSVSISGPLAIVSDTNCTGPVHIYERAAVGWQKIFDIHPPGDVEGFGSALAVSGDTLAVGAASYSQQVDLPSIRGLAHDPVTDTLYAVGAGALVTIDRATGVPTRVPPLSYGEPCTGGGTLSININGLAFDAGTGTLYGTTSQDSHLLVIDTATGLTTDLGALGFKGVKALACDPATGMLWAVSDNTDELLQIDPVPVTTTVIGAVGFNRVHGLTWSAATGTLLASDSLTDTLISIDPNTGAGTIIGPVGTFANKGLASESSTGRLWGVTDSNILELDETTGASTPVGPYQQPRETGAVFVFERNQGGPNQWGETAFLTVPDAPDGANFGSFVDLDGDTLVASGADPRIPIRIYERIGAAWVEAAVLDHPYVGEYPVALSGDRLAVGFPFAIHQTTGGFLSYGFVDVFERDSGGPGAWGPVSRVTPSESHSQARFGHDLDLDGDTLIVGAVRNALGLGASAYLFERDAGGPGAWGQIVRITDPDGEGHVAISGDTVLVEGDVGGIRAFERNGGSIGGWGEVSGLGVGTPGPLFKGVFDLEKTSAIVMTGFSQDVEIHAESGALGYCTAGTTTSGCTAALSATGSASVSAASGFQVTATGVEGAKQGLIYFGSSGAKATPWGAGSSFQCVKGPHVRTPVQFSGGTAGSCDGTFTLDFNAWMATNPAKAPVGTDVFMQAWFRDPGAPKTTSLSDAIQFAVCP